jgi:hypothetical protein
MTERAHSSIPARRARRRPAASVVASSALIVFLVVFVLLGWQLASGHDPALGALPAPEPHQVVVQQIQRRIIVTDVPRDSAVASVSSGGSQGAASSPPVAAAPAPAPAPAPATQSS